MVNVLFVCMGNICRSPAGEGVFKQYVEEQNCADDFFIDSAGTIGYHEGKPADARMREAAERRAYNLTSTSRKFSYGDFEEFDLIIAMDRDNLDDIRSMTHQPHEHIYLLGSFLPGKNQHNAPDVPDPYYGGEEGFDTVLDMIEQACPNILAFTNTHFK